MITTTFALIVFTTLFFGSFMAWVGSKVVPDNKPTAEHEQPLLDHDEHEEHVIVHPNEEKDWTPPLEKVDYWRWADSRLVRWYCDIHEQKLKPSLTLKPRLKHAMSEQPADLPDLTPAAPALSHYKSERRGPNTDSSAASYVPPSDQSSLMHFENRPE